MANNINDGGPAFPVARYFRDGSVKEPEGTDKGMTLHDYFAAHAPISWQDAIDTLDGTGECVGPWPGVKILECLVLLRNAYADAMLAARDKERK